ncbi:MAG: hypothetical protein BSOLF_2643 [Candidatus Carbobacillus altaicus]|uniref:Uncharacterized protein n=1 Tax=Candidatus Carbonibacillus altaicus TaxID=2163959 RepID=A0A2R6Y2F6_9BACL|nr:MAG: hypothetical protein BSOLF_2643 [Candidatus Carbobacillus altaicus]
MSYMDAIRHWLEIELVARARPEDKAAIKTADFFNRILQEDHHIIIKNVQKADDRYLVTYEESGDLKETRFDRYQVEGLLLAIEHEPKYGIVYPEEEDEEEADGEGGKQGKDGEINSNLEHE